MATISLYGEIDRAFNIEEDPEEIDGIVLVKNCVYPFGFVIKKHSDKMWLIEELIRGPLNASATRPNAQADRMASARCRAMGSLCQALKNSGRQSDPGAPRTRSKGKKRV